MIPFILLSLNILVWSLLYIGFRRSIHNVQKGSSSTVPISVLVALKNEEAQVPTLVEAFKKQIYPHFEVIFINDGSTDQTTAQLRLAIGDDLRFRLYDRPDDMRSGKKFALTYGILQAKHAHLAFTDADCVPSPTWLRQLAGHITTIPDAVWVGYGPFLSEPTLLNLFVRYETNLTAYLTAAFTGWGQAYMAVGRNLSYPKKTFEEVQGFASHQHLLSGDDDLFIQTVQAHKTSPIYMVLEQEAWVYSSPPSSFRVWFRQKNRHFSAARGYARRAMVGLSVIQMLQILSWAVLFWDFWTGLLALSLRWLFMATCFSLVSVRLHTASLLLLIPLLDGLYHLMNLVVAPFGYLKKTLRW